MAPIAQAKGGRAATEVGGGDQRAAAVTKVVARDVAVVRAPLRESESMPSIFRGRPLAWVAGLALAIAVVWPVLRAERLARWLRWPAGLDFFAREPVVQQVTGFVALGLFALTLLLPLKRKLGKRLGGRRELWRLAHALLGLGLAGVLLVHTSARLGRGGNLALSLATLALVGVGTILGLAWRRNPPQRRAVGRGLRPLHLWLFWPTLGLLAVHVLAVYYF